MASIFISYRRDDSSGWAGRLKGELRAEFGDDNVFFDLDTLDPGINYVEAIERRLDAADVTLVVIGPRWLTATDKQGKRRLDDPTDQTRIEAAKALTRNTRVIPVLVGGAAMPSAEDLPEDIRDLARRQNCEISDRRWDFDRGHLVEVIKQLSAAKPRTFPRLFPSFRSRISALLLLLAAAAGVAAWIFLMAPARERQIALALCVPSDHGMNSATETAIQDYLVARGRPRMMVTAVPDLNPEERRELKRATSEVGDCRQAGFRNAFEVGKYGVGSDDEKLDQLRALQDDLMRVLQLAALPKPTPGKLDFETRRAIAAVRRQMNLNPALEGQVDAEFLAAIRTR